MVVFNCFNISFLFLFHSNSMASSSKATLVLLIYGIIMHYSVYCTPIGLSYPKIRYVNVLFLPLCLYM